MNPYISFGLIGVINVLFAIATLCMVQEPPDLRKDSMDMLEEKPKLSRKEKCKNLMSNIANCFKILWKSIWENKELMISFLIAMEAQGANTLADTYLMSWL